MAIKNLNLTKENLYQLIIIENKQCKDVAKQLNCSPSAISKWLKIYRISRTDRNLNKKFGWLELLEPVGHDIFGHILWKCKCKCGNEVTRTYSSFNYKGNKSCGCARLKASFKHHLFKGHGEISSVYWNRIKARANKSKSKKLSFDISIEYAWELFLEQNRQCKFSGIKLNFPTHSKTNDGTASLDRIDSNEGYIKGNIQWVHKRINMMKQSMSDQEFIQWCSIVSNFNRS